MDGLVGTGHALASLVLTVVVAAGVVTIVAWFRRTYLKADAKAARSATEYEGIQAHALSAERCHSTGARHRSGFVSAKAIGEPTHSGARVLRWRPGVFTLKVGVANFIAHYKSASDNVNYKTLDQDIKFRPLEPRASRETTRLVSSACSFVRPASAIAASGFGKS